MQIMQISPEAEDWNEIKCERKTSCRSFSDATSPVATDCPTFFLWFCCNFRSLGMKKKTLLENSKVHRVNKTESLCVSFLLFFFGIPSVMVQWSNRRKKDNKRALYKRKRVMCFWRAWNNNWRIRFFSRNQQTRNPVSSCVPSFRCFCIPSHSPFDRFFLSSPSSSLLCLWNSLFLRPFYPFFFYFNSVFQG